MNRNQRRAHATLWPVLLLLMITIGGGALFAKARIENAATELGAND